MRLIPRALTSVTLLVASSFALQALAAPRTQLEKSLDEFNADPKAFINRTPPKYASGGARPQALFSSKDIASREFITKKSKLGPQGKKQTRKKGLAEWEPDRLTIADFVDTSDFATRGISLLSKLSDMDSIKEAALPETPWSDTYWPIVQGVIGARYASETTPMGYAWKSNFDLISAQSLKAVYDSNDAVQIDSLSPSEKYDLLIGDLTQNGQVYQNGYMTPFMWKTGEAYYNQSGSVEGWMGICHGWSPASFMVPRPKNSVIAKAADGKTDLKFYPSDLKGLSSYLWSLGTVPSLFMGSRCNTKKPATDPESGRIIQPECWDANPANWHLAIVNQIGVAKRGFVMDATYDYQVWNQPVFGYSYKYFNPQTRAEVATMEEAKVAMADFTNDKFKKYRSPRAVSSVGIAMNVTYVSETAPTHAEVDMAANDATNTVVYLYDLELDVDGNVIGGEWYYNAHPDFMWSPIHGGRAASYGDGYISRDSIENAWKPGDQLPSFWRDVARKTAIRYGQPLAAIVEAMVAQSHLETKIAPPVPTPAPTPAPMPDPAPPVVAPAPNVPPAPPAAVTPNAPRAPNMPAAPAPNAPRAPNMPAAPAPNAPRAPNMPAAPAPNAPRALNVPAAPAPNAPRAPNVPAVAAPNAPRAPNMPQPSPSPAP